MKRPLLFSAALVSTLGILVVHEARNSRADLPTARITSAPGAVSPDTGDLPPRIRPTPLDDQTRLKRFGALTSGTVLTSAMLGGAVSFTPRQLYVSPNVSASVSLANVSGANNTAFLFHSQAPGTSSGTVWMSVRPGVGKTYLVDCTIERNTGDESYDVLFNVNGTVSNATVTGTNGHITFAMPKSTTTAVATVRLRKTDQNSSASWYGCDFFPVTL